MTKRYNRVMNVAMTKKQLLNCVDQMNSGLLITDENGVIKYFNNAYLQLTKLSGLEIGDNIMTYYHQELLRVSLPVSKRFIQRIRLSDNLHRVRMAFLSSVVRKR